METIREIYKDVLDCFESTESFVLKSITDDSCVFVDATNGAELVFSVVAGKIDLKYSVDTPNYRKSVILFMAIPAAKLIGGGFDSSYALFVFDSNPDGMFLIQRLSEDGSDFRIFNRYTDRVTRVYGYRSGNPFTEGDYKGSLAGI